MAGLRPQMANGLHWVRGEIEQSLGRVRVELEQYLEAPEEKQRLSAAAEELHLVRGTVGMIECFGAAALADEMLQLLQELAAGRSAHVDEAFAALSGATLQLSDYVDLLAEGEDDRVVVLQPVINELRLARGKPLLTEAELFAAQLRAQGAPPRHVDWVPVSGETVQSVARRELAAFQNSFLLWYRGQSADSAMARMGKIADAVAVNASDPGLHEMWSACAVLAECLRGDQPPESLDVKRLFGRAGSLLKVLVESGETAAAAQVGDTPQQFLFHIARAARQTERSAKLVQERRIEALLPAVDQVDELRKRLRGPNVSILARVYNEIRRDFGQIKDGIDMAVRTGGRTTADLGPTCDRIQRLATTLGALGLPMPQQALINQSRALAGPPSGAAVWMEIATSILRVEHTLEDALFRVLRGGGAETQKTYGEIESEVPHAQDLREGIKALLRESLVDFARLKVGVDSYLKTGDKAGLADAPQLLGEVAAGLLIVDQGRAHAQVRKLQDYAKLGTLAAAGTPQLEFERFADAVSCVEVYLEALRDGLPDSQPILEDLERYVGRLDFSAPASVAPLAPVEPPAAAPAPPAPVAAEAIDPEIRDIFIEEAAEVLAELQHSLPQLKREPANRTLLVGVRRAFHTLKGSGRMVGAKRIGEFGWQLENMLNRCLEASRPVRAPMLNAVDDAVKLLPALIESFRDPARPEPPEVAALLERVVALASGKVGAEPDMYAVFREDARERLGGVRRWLEEQDLREAWFSVEPDMVRAFHTLRGSAAVIHAEGVSQLAAAFESYFNGLRLEHRQMPAAALSLIADALVTLHTWIESPGVAEAGASEIGGWNARIATLQAQPAEPSAPPRQAVDESFAEQALGELQTAERQLRAWIAQPAQIEPEASELAAGFGRLAALAQAADCVPVGRIAQALAGRLQGWQGDVQPAPGFFEALLEVFEGLYQQLDAYREGRLEGEGAEWLARVEALPPPVAVAAAGPVAIEAPAPESHPAFAGDELLGIFSGEAEELLEAIEHYLEVWRRQPGYADAPIEIKRALHTLMGSARTAGAPVIGTVAQSLKKLFADEAEHTLPAVQAPLAVGLDELHHLLHGLRRGDALDAAPALGAIEAAVPPELLAAPAPVPDYVPSAPMNYLPETPALELELPPEPVLTQPPPPLLEMLPQAPEPAAELPMAPALEAPAVQPVDSIPELIPQVFAPAPPLPQEPVAAPPPVAPAVFVPVPPPAHRPLPAAPSPQGLDDELTEVFAAEAAELLEQLDLGFEAWENGDDTEAVRDVQRALHTLKGGARMAGLDAMGDVAHELETRVNTVLADAGFPEPGEFAHMRGQLEQLQSMHDQIQRGEAELLAAPAPPVVELAPPPAPAAAVIPSAWDPQLFWQPEEELSAFALSRRETARVPVESLDSMLNQAGEISIYRSRLEERNAGQRVQLTEVTQTIARVREQLRLLDIETEAQMAARGRGLGGAETDRYHQDFDPLEMDRYTRMQELSRTLAESIGDLASLQASMDEMVSESETLLLQQSRVTSEVQQGLMSTLMVPFSRQVQRLIRVVRQTATDNGKQAEVQFQGVEAELDRNVLERVTAPLEHLLRNAVVHGIEDPAERALAGKPVVGGISVRLAREGGQLLVEVADDGRGLDFAAIRAKAVERGLLVAEAQLSDDDLARFIFEPGFTTARRLTQDAGRGIGMDVVSSEVKQLGGTLELRSETGKGARFLLRLPLTLAVSQALLVGAGQDSYAVPLPSIEGIARIPRAEIQDYYRDDGPLFAYGGRGYRVRHLGDFVGVSHAVDPDVRSLTAILVRLGEGLGAGERRVALVVDQLYGNREIVSKAVGPQVSAVPGVAGGTILADGRVVLILDVAALVAERARRTLLAEAAGLAKPLEAAETRELVMVVDDSITMRRVAERLLARNGYRVSTAKDGLDAIAMLQTETPSVVLLDIEMPRADGFEVAAFIRNNSRLNDVPIIIITSRSGEKHRNRARELGVDRYLIKPYQEDELLSEVRSIRKGVH